MSTQSQSSRRGIAVNLPEHLGEPLVIRRHGLRLRVERPDGSQLPIDPWGNRRAEGADGSRVRIEPAIGIGRLCHAVRISGRLVALEPPLDPRERVWIIVPYALVWAAGILLEAAYLVLALGLVVVVAGGWIAARQLRRRDDPRRRIRATVTMVIASCAAVALYALFRLLWQF